MSQSVGIEFVQTAGVEIHFNGTLFLVTLYFMFTLRHTSKLMPGHIPKVKLPRLNGSKHKRDEFGRREIIMRIPQTPARVSNGPFNVLH